MAEIDSSRFDPSRFTVLVVEDDWLIRTAVVDFLKSADCEVMQVATGEAAVALLQASDRINAVITDIRLGGELDGWDVGEASRAANPSVAVVYTSGTAMTPPREMEGSVLFSKPYDPAEILETCRSLSRAR